MVLDAEVCGGDSTSGRGWLRVESLGLRVESQLRV
jgi:hypothetical protein